MENKEFIKILEPSKDGMTLIEKWENMNFIKNFIYKIISPVIEEKDKEIKTLQKEIKSIQEQLEELSGEHKFLSGQVQDGFQKTAMLLNDFNTKKASSESKYRDAIDVLYKLNDKFIDSVSSFGRADKLELLEKLVNYLYEPNDDIRETILTSKQLDESSKQLDESLKAILKAIDVFNDKHKANLVNYLSKINVKWENCVLFPKTKEFDSQIMTPYYDLKLEDGVSVYIISLGFAFPNSNAEKQLPQVFKRSTKLLVSNKNKQVKK